MKKNGILKMITSLALPLAAGALGSVFTAKAIPSWYVSIQKPFFNPPSWVFGPVWTVLYVLMGISFFMIWRMSGGTEGRKNAIRVFLWQLSLNAIWTPIFFGFKSPEAALLVILALWVMIVKTIRIFGTLNRSAAYLLIPYLLWVSFAALLNGAIAYLN